MCPFNWLFRFVVCFFLLFRYDITDTLLEEFGITANDVATQNAEFTIEVQLTAVNGTRLPPNTLSRPTVIFQGAASE